MTIIRIPFLVLAISFGLCAVVAAADGSRRTIVYEGVVTEVGPSPAAAADPSELWVTTADLTRATKFEIKPQGVCRDELCFPIPKDKKDRLVARQGRTAIGDRHQPQVDLTGLVEPRQIGQYRHVIEVAIVTEDHRRRMSGACTTQVRRGHDQEHDQQQS